MSNERKLEKMLEQLLEKVNNAALKTAAPAAAAPAGLPRHRVSPAHTRYSDSPEAFVLDLDKRVNAIEESLGLEKDEDAGAGDAPSDDGSAGAPA